MLQYIALIAEYIGSVGVFIEALTLSGEDDILQDGDIVTVDLDSMSYWEKIGHLRSRYATI